MKTDGYDLINQLKGNQNEKNIIEVYDQIYNT